MLKKTFRLILGSLLLIIGLNAIGGGIYGISGAQALPLTWLNNSPFKSYLLPSLILFFIVGGSALMAAWHIFKETGYGIASSFVDGIILCIWVIVQVAIIGYVSWMQPAIGIAAILILLFTTILNKK